MSRSRNWCFTLNNYNTCDEHESYGIAWLDHFKYVVVGKEVGEEGTPHLQGYVCWSTLKSLEQMRALFEGRAHWEIMRGEPEQAANYCKKDGDFYEYGEAPMTQKEKGDANAERWKQARDAAERGEWDKVPDDIYIKYVKNLEYIRSKNLVPEQLDGELTHEWWYGKPGTGKTRKAWDEYPDSYIKDPKSVWWDGYNGQETVIIDDFDKFQVSQGGEMKRWLDRYPFQAQVKGGYITIRPKKVIVTSNYKPEDIWDDEVTVAAIERRIKKTYFSEQYVYAPYDNISKKKGGLA